MHIVDFGQGAGRTGLWSFPGGFAIPSGVSSTISSPSHALGPVQNCGRPLSRGDR